MRFSLGKSSALSSRSCDSSLTKSEILRGQNDNISPCTFRITSQVAFNEPQICAVVVDLDVGTYTANIGYSLTNGQCSLFCRRWDQYNIVSSDGYTPDIVEIGSANIAMHVVQQPAKFRHRKWRICFKWYRYFTVWRKMNAKIR